MNELTIYNFEGSEVRTVTIGDAVWLVAKDVADRLGYKWNGNRTIAHIPEKWRGVESVPTPSGDQDMAVISESGFYFFLGRSDKPKAFPMQEWFAGEVMPSIRKTGSYSAAPALTEMDKAALMFQQTAQQFASMGIAVHETRLLVETTQAEVRQVEAKIEALAIAVEPERIAAQLDDRIEQYEEARIAEARQLRGVKASLSFFVDSIVDHLVGKAPCDPPPKEWRDRRGKAFRQINHIAKTVGGARDQMDLTGALEACEAVRRHGELLGIALPPGPKVVNLNAQRRI